MRGFINDFDWLNVSPMKYWSFTSGTSDAVKKETVRNAVFSGEYIGSLKVDGYYSRFLKDEDGNIFMIARSRNVKGEIVDKHEWLPHLNPWFEALPNGTCFLCECYWPGNEGSKNITSILGCLKEKAIARQKDAPLHLYVFDCMAWNGKNFNKEKYSIRARAISQISAMPKIKSPYIEWAQFFEGQELWSHLQEYLASGREGMVIMRKDAIVYDKRTPARISIKVKKELEQTIDCFFTGKASAPTHEYTGKELETWIYWEDSRTGELRQGELFKDYAAGATIIPVTKGYFNHWAGSLEIAVLKKKEGAVATCGVQTIKNYEIYTIGWLSNLSDEVKAEPKKFAWKPIEVTAMELDQISGALRHGKLKTWRNDLEIKDCCWEKIWG